MVVGMWIMLMAQSCEDGTMPILAAAFDESTKNGDFWGPETRLTGKHHRLIDSSLFIILPMTTNVLETF